MKYKMIAVDMDGTLLDDRKQIPDETVHTIRQMAGTGVLFVISTGRPVQGVEKYKELLHLTGPMITCNGAVIVDAGTGETLFEQGLVRSDAEKIFHLGKKYDVTMCIWAGGRLYGNRLDEKMNDYKKISGVEPILAEDFENLPDQEISKIVWYEDESRMKRLITELPEGRFSQVTACLSQPVQVSKAAAMQKIGEMYGIRREEMIAVGDGPNDIEMLKYAGMGVAMGNASDEVKRHAGFITSSNKEEGVRQAIRRFF